MIGRRRPPLPHCWARLLEPLDRRDVHPLLRWLRLTDSMPGVRTVPHRANTPLISSIRHSQLRPSWRVNFTVPRVETETVSCARRGWFRGRSQRERRGRAGQGRTRDGAWDLLRDVDREQPSTVGLLLASEELSGRVRHRDDAGELPLPVMAQRRDDVNAPLSIRQLIRALCNRDIRRDQPVRPGRTVRVGGLSAKLSRLNCSMAARPLMTRLSSAR